MPKDIHTPREELICGKIDQAVEACQREDVVRAIDLLDMIRHDAERMEAKLIWYKREFSKKGKRCRIPSGNRCLKDEAECPGCDFYKM